MTNFAKIAGAVAGALLIVGGAASALATTTPASPATAALAAVSTFPTPQTTGVPGGIALSPYAGPTTIRSCGVTIDAAQVAGDLTVLASNGFHDAQHPCVTISRSFVSGIVDDKWSSYSCAGHSGCGPVVITDSEVSNPTARDVAAVSDANVFITRSYIHGARSGVQCDGNCTVKDSYLLADVESGTAHMDAFITNGNYGAPMTLDHDSFLCAPQGSVPNGSGCAADVGLFGDFSAVTNMVVTNNIFRATNDAYYCLHSPYEPGKPFPNGGNDTFTGNVFEKGSSGKCGGANAVFNWNNVAGTWCNNLFDDGSQVLPGNPDNCGSNPPTTVTTTTVPITPTSGSTPSSVPAPTTTKPATTSTTKPTVTTTTAPPTTTTTVPPPFSVGPINCTIDGRTHAVLHCP